MSRRWVREAWLWCRCNENQVFFWFSELHRVVTIWVVDTEEEDDVGRGRWQPVTLVTEVYALSPSGLAEDGGRALCQWTPRGFGRKALGEVHGLTTKGVNRRMDKVRKVNYSMR